MIRDAFEVVEYLSRVFAEMSKTVHPDDTLLYVLNVAYQDGAEAQADTTAAAISARIKSLTDSINAAAYSHYGATEPGSVDWETLAHIEGLKDAARLNRGAR